VGTLRDAKLNEAVANPGFVDANGHSCGSCYRSPRYRIEAAVVLRAFDDIAIDETIGEMSLAVRAQTVDDDAFAVTSLDNGVGGVSDVASAHVVRGDFRLGAGAEPLI